MGAGLRAQSQLPVWLRLAILSAAQPLL